MESEGRDGWVTVLVPTYNRAPFLIGALDSVYEQTYRPIELIVIDDGSTDETKARVTHWTRQHWDESFQVHYLYQENAGPSAARNRGLIHSSGEFIQFLDSDDRMHPQKLSIHVQALEREPSCDAVLGNNVRYDPRKETPAFQEQAEERLVETAERQQMANELSLMGGNLLNGLYRRTLCRQAGPINESLRRMEDVEYNIRMSAAVSAIRIVEAPLLAFGRHGSDHLTGVANQEEGVDTGLASVTAMEETLDGLDVGPDADVRQTVANFYMGIARLAMKEGRPDAVEQSLAGALRNRRDLSFRAQVGGLRVARWFLGDERARVLWSWAKGMGS